MRVRDVRWLGVHVLVVFASAMAGCGDSPTGPSAYAPFSIQELRPGTGTAATAGSTVSVKYALWLYDSAATDGKGPMVESNIASDLFIFRLSIGAVIQGFDDGVNGMLEGGIRRIIVPPSRGYGGVRNGAIPPNSTLVFEIELIDVT